LERTDALAKATDQSLRGLAPVLGLSVASLFGYRSGSIKISPKAWSKLEQAERGFLKKKMAEFEQNAESEGKVKDLETDDTKAYSSTLREDPATYRFTPMGGQCQGHEPHDQPMLAVLTRIAESLEKLVEVMNSNNARK
jgi:hypothetical protein